MKTPCFILFKLLSNSATHKLIRAAVAIDIIRLVLNYFYNKLNCKQSSYFYPLSKAYRLQLKPFPEVTKIWRLIFGKSMIKVHLSPSSIWLDWGLVFMTAHDWEITQTNLNLIRTDPPKLFVDIGANYGTHSLLHLCNNIPSLTFEPNPHA